MKGNSKKTTEGQKKEELKNEIRSYLNDYQSINEDTTITENTKMVLSMLLYTGNGQDKFTIGYRYIEEVMGISKNSISPIVGKLEKKGFINRTKGTRGKNSEYTLNYETMESYVSNCPSVQVSKCTTKKHKKGVQVSKCPSVQPNETTCTPTCTVKDADIQLLIKQNEEKIQLNKRTNELLEKLCNLYINNNINNNINKNLKDNISSNNNTEGNNIKYQEKKKNISTGNLEKLKENSKDEISNDEIIPSENESLNEIENTSKVKSSNNENLNESRIPSDESNISDNENPNDMPPLDVDSLFEDDSNPLTEYRTNENLNEENEISRDENPSKANGSSKEDGGLSKDKNPSDENPEDNEISVFGDSNSTDEDKDKDNDKWYESSRSSKSDNHANGMFTNLISELTSNENPKANEISNDNNSKTSENMKKTNNKTNTIPSEGKNPSDEKTLKNINAFGKLQSFRDLKTGRIDGYQFNSYDNLNDSRDYSKSFHASVLCLNLEPSDLKKVSVSDTGVWGILNRTNGVYSFIPSNVGPSYAPNSTPQAHKTAAVDNHTTEGEIIAPEQSQIANKASGSNTNTTANDKEDEKATETVYADENTDEVDNHTTDEEITAGNSVKMRPEPSDSNTNTEKVDSTQSQKANKASNEYADDLEDDAETIAIRERVMRQNAARAQQTEKKSDDKTPKDFDYYKRTPDGWKEIPIHITMENKKMTMGEALELYKNFDNPLLYIYSIMRYVQDFCEKMKTALRLKAITDEQYEAFKNELNEISAGYKAYWRTRFSYQKPDPNSSAEKDMHRWLGSPKVTQGKN